MAISGADVVLVKNGGYAANVAQLLAMCGGIGHFINPTDIVVLKCNGQWPKQGYTHTGCIKTLCDAILAMPGFSGEVLICDNVQIYGATGAYGFDATAGTNRENNWADHNWNSLAAEYQAAGKPVATKRWYNGAAGRTGPEQGVDGQGMGWRRDTFSFHGENVTISAPFFVSPLTANSIIDLHEGLVWSVSGGEYTSQAVKTIVMSGLNNHGSGSEDYAGMTGAIKSIFGASEIPGGVAGSIDGVDHIHSGSYERGYADYAGELVARWVTQHVTPVLWICCAQYAGHHSRTGAATATDTVAACLNPATLDYETAKRVIAPISSWLDPDAVPTNNTRLTIDGSITGGVGTLSGYVVTEYDFSNPPAAAQHVSRGSRGVQGMLAAYGSSFGLFQAWGVPQ